MGKKIIFLIIFLWITTCIHLSAQDSRRFLDSLRADLGVKEVGNNGGTRVNQYLASCGLGTGYPWCAAYINYHAKDFCTPPKRAAGSYSWFPKNKRIPFKAIKEGDLVGFYFKSLGRIGHIGAITNYKGGNTIITIEGNTSSSTGLDRDGQGVYSKRRMKFQISFYARWIYDKEPKTKTKKLLQRKEVKEIHRTILTLRSNWSPVGLAKIYPWYHAEN
jgi:hypothetical protein